MNNSLAQAISALASPWAPNSSHTPSTPLPYTGSHWLALGVPQNCHHSSRQGGPPRRTFLCPECKVWLCAHDSVCVNSVLALCLNLHQTLRTGSSLAWPPTNLALPLQSCITSKASGLELSAPGHLPCTPTAARAVCPRAPPICTPTAARAVCPRAPPICTPTAARAVCPRAPPICTPTAAFFIEDDGGEDSLLRNPTQPLQCVET